MTPETFHRARDVFDDALELEGERRDAHVESACAGDAALLADVRSLISMAGVAKGCLQDGVGRALLRLPDDVHGATPREEHTIGPYEIVRELGHGGMGTVYLAERSDGEARGRVALKLVRLSMASDEILARFVSERQILAGLSHPNIPRLLDGGTTADGLPYFVMEFVEGRHLLDHADGERLDVRGRLRLFRAVCDAVSYAHRNRVVHGDLKPANILVTRDGSPRLLDFGLAKLVAPSRNAPPDLTASSHRMLTPEYASPEQVRGERVTTSSDVYSLGVVLYRLLTGTGPYRVTGRSVEELARAVLEEQPRSVLPRLGEDLDAILRKALRKEPERRYASAALLSEDLRRHVEGLPVLVW